VVIHIEVWAIRRPICVKDELSAKFEGSKARQVGLTSHVKEQDAGVSVTRLWKRGNIDYKKIPELKVLELDQYRGSPREEARITTIAG